MKFLLITYFAFCSLFTLAQTNNETLWYQQPAASWYEALPVGNGRLGAMVFGRTDIERIQLNDESLWAGSKIDDNNPRATAHLKEIQQLLIEGENEKATQLANENLLSVPLRLRSYQTLGDLYLDFGSQRGIKITDYKRSLDLMTGISTTEYDADGVHYKREIFASAPNNCIVMKLTADKPQAITCKLFLTRERDASVTAIAHNKLLMQGQIIDIPSEVLGRGGLDMKFNTELQASNQGGSIVSANNTLLISDANAVTIVLTAATDYNFSKLNFDRSISPKFICDKIINDAVKISFAQLIQKHLKEYQPMFSRMSLSLGDNDFSNIPTDKRIDSFKNGSNDQNLMALYFQYGRYLLMSSSRKPGVLPANLQGIWNEDYEAPWNSDYHFNINLEMNYWPAEVCNLSETTIPLINYIDNYRVPGRVTAKKMYNAKGWDIHHASDIFGKTAIIDGLKSGVSPLMGSWLCLNLWQHFLFAQDTAYLREKIYPIMKGSAEFIQSFLIKDNKNGYLVTAPSISPENTFILPDGNKSSITVSPTIDVELTMELYRACIDAENFLNVDKNFSKQIQSTLQKIPPLQISKKDGRLQEWIEDYKDAEPGHRHLSHLLSLYPGSLINKNTPELLEAAAKAIDARLAHHGGATGWSAAWLVNCFARLYRSEDAYRQMSILLQQHTMKNMFDKWIFRSKLSHYSGQTEPPQDFIRKTLFRA